MRISDHKLVEHWFEESKDVNEKPMVGPKFIVMHYTAGGNGAGSRDYMLKSPEEKAELLGVSKPIYGSAHLVIDRKGKLWQIVPFNKRARHAGTSEWKGIKYLNHCSIGIELANYGWLNQQGDGSFSRPEISANFNADEVSLGKMPNDPTEEIKGWENYTKEQLETLEKVVLCLLDEYPSITEIIRHQDISPGRKFDPGPAFPIHRFQNLIDHRGAGTVETKDEPNISDQYITTTTLNIRGGAGSSYEKLSFGPLAEGTRVRKLDEEGNWYFVRIEGATKNKGWVYKKYLQLAEEQTPPDQYFTRVVLNIRSGPGTSHDKLAFGPLDKATLLNKIEEKNGWIKVSLESDPNKVGWVSSKYLELS